MALTGGFLLALLGLASLAALVCTAVLPRRGWRLASLTLCLLFTALTFGAVENDQFGYDRSWSALFGTASQPDLVTGVHVHLAPSAPGESRLGWPAVAQSKVRPGHGFLLAVDFAGSHSGIDRSGYVYLPPQYFQPAYAHDDFPALELLAGSPGAPKNWLNQLEIVQVADRLLSQHRMAPMVLVIPAPNSHLVQSEECVNAVKGAQDDTYLSQDVRADVLAGLRVSPSRSAWGLAGYSTGGFCAVNLLTRHSDQYSAAASMDGYFHALNDHYTGNIYHGDRAAQLANSPDWVWAHHPPAPPVSLLLVAGGDDESATAASVQFHDQLASSAPVVRGGDTVDLQIHRHAGHTFIAWRADLPSVLSWAGQRLQPPTPAPPGNTQMTLAPPTSQPSPASSPTDSPTGSPTGSPVTSGSPDEQRHHTRSRGRVRAR